MSSGSTDQREVYSGSLRHSQPFCCWCPHMYGKNNKFTVNMFTSALAILNTSMTPVQAVGGLFRTYEIPLLLFHTMNNTFLSTCLPFHCQREVYSGSLRHSQPFCCWCPHMYGKNNKFTVNMFTSALAILNTSMTPVQAVGGLFRTYEIPLLLFHTMNNTFLSTCLPFHCQREVYSGSLRHSQPSAVGDLPPH